jgi:hypothetical protein
MALVLARLADATVYLSENPVPNPANTLVIFQVCVAVDTVFDVCALNVPEVGPSVPRNQYNSQVAITGNQTG